MEIILLEKIANLGTLGDKVKVKAGYGRNFLIPKGKAVMATKANLAAFEERRAELEQKAAEALTDAESRKEQLEDTHITIAVKAGAEGKLFGSVGAVDISDALTAAGMRVEKREVRMPEGPIRVVGEYEIGIHLHTDIDVIVTLTVIAES